jgi:hypothetical protein
MLCLEVMHNVSMRLGRMDVVERAFCRLLLLFNVLERFAVVGFQLLNGTPFVTPLFAFISKNDSNIDNRVMS